LEAKIGDKIVVSPGRYREALRINKAIQIIGDGHLSVNFKFANRHLFPKVCNPIILSRSHELQDVIIESNGKDTIIAETEFGSLSKITLRQKGDGFWSCVDIIAGQFNVEGCDVSSKSLTCISIHRKDTKSRIWRNRIHDCGGTGIFVFDGAKPLIEDNEIYDNAQSGIEITEGSDPEVKFNRIRGNAQHGILVHDNGKGVLTDNEIYKNGLAGIEVRESGHARIHRNKIYSHDTSGGIYVHHYGRADIEKNDIYQNGLSGVACWQSGKPVCRLNRITANGEHGIHVRDGGWGTYEDNDVRANGRGGVRVAPDCALKVILNRNLVD
jgi:parallel beta-helix repeat protein